MNGRGTPVGPAETVDVDPRALELHAAARELPTAERPAFLDAVCQGDARLRAELDALLREDDEPVALPDGDPLDLEPGALVATRYRIVRRIGRGGLGVVFLAEQLAPVRREVALKLIGGDGRDDEAFHHFAAERDALAALSHPYVAHILDAGVTERGDLYVAMEHIDGLGLIEHCDQRRLDLAARLRLFVDVCRGVHHAHQRGVIHRDLKPSNILVAHRGDVDVPKIIDFGIAKAVLATHQTSVDADAPPERRVVGTPEYMSPEQAGATPGGTDASSDIYALGVILYQLLCGELPRVVPPSARLDLEGLRAALSGPPPAPPSARARAAGRSLPSDLDFIAARAMARDRAERYESAAALGADVQRWLAGDPVLAHPASLTYRLRRYAGRHRALVVAITLAVVALIGAAIALSNMAWERAEQARRAEVESLRASQEQAIARETRELAGRLQTRTLLNTAEIALSARDAGMASRSLDAIAPSERRWEWRHLRWLSDRSVASVAAHSDRVLCLALARDAPVLVSASQDGGVKAWRPDDLLPIRDLGQHLSPVRSLTVSADGRWAASADQDGRMTVWEVATGGAAWRLEGVRALGELAFTADGTALLVSQAEERSIDLRDAATGEVLARRAISAPTAFRPSFFDDDRAVIFTDLYRTLAVRAPTRAAGAALAPADRLWTSPGKLERLSVDRRRYAVREPPDYNAWALYETRDGARIAGFESMTPEPFHSVAIGPEGTFIAGADRTALHLSEDPGHATPGPPLGPLIGHAAQIHGLVTDPTGDHLYAGDGHGVIKRWDAQTTPSPFIVPRSNDVIFGAAFDPERRTVVTTGWGAVKRWELATGRELWTRVISRAYLTAVTVAPDGAALAVGDWTGRLWALDPEDGATRWESETGLGRVSAVGYSADGARLAVGGDDGTLLLVNAADGDVVARWSAHRSSIGAVLFGPDGDWLATGSGDELLVGIARERYSPMGGDATLRLWRTDAPERLIETLTVHEGKVVQLHLHPDGETLASASRDGSFGLWRVPDGELIARSFGAGPHVTAVTVSPDGTRWITAHATGPLLVWDAERVEPVLAFGGPGSDVLALAFSPDGETLWASAREAPVAAYETKPTPTLAARREYARARRLVERLAAERVSTDAVVDALEADANLPAGLRATAVALARARGDHVNFLNSEAWAVVRYPGGDASELTLARTRAQVALASQPERWQIWNTLALAHYRLGEDSDAVRAVDRSLTLQRDLGLAPYAGDLAIRAMARWRLGDRATAEGDLAAAIAALANHALADDSETLAVLDEARAIVGR